MQNTERQRITRKMPIPGNLRQLIVDRIINIGESPTVIAADLRLKHSTVTMMLKDFAIIAKLNEIPDVVGVPVN